MWYNKQLVLVRRVSECDMSVSARMNACIGVFGGSVGRFVPHTPTLDHLSHPRKGESPVLFIHGLPSCVPLTCFSINFSGEEHTPFWLQLPTPTLS